MPSQGEQQFVYETTPVDYRPGGIGAPDAGRNIFAFYEPPPPCDPKVPGDCPPPPPPKPSPTPVVPTPTPIPTPPIQLAGITPSSVYAGQKAFKMELTVGPVPANAKVYFNQIGVQTALSGQRLVADIPANLIAQPGNPQVIVQTPDGKMYSNALGFQVVAPPKPQVQYIGMISRARHNNDTAYLINAAPGTAASAVQSATPYAVRLNDVVNTRFKLVEITPAEVTFEDIDLGFRHRVAINRTITPTTGGPAPGSGFSPFPGQGVPQQITIGPDGIPVINGVPINIPQPNPNITPPQP